MYLEIRSINVSRKSAILVKSFSVPGVDRFVTNPLYALR
jgi:hypothetical protein